MENKQTAVDWLVSQVEDFYCLLPVDMIDKAKQMEREQIAEDCKDKLSSADLLFDMEAEYEAKFKQQ